MDVFLKRLIEKKVIPDSKIERIEKFEDQKTMSIFLELRFALVLGISLLSGGLGTLVYKNIGTIGHEVLILAIGMATIFLFWYAFKNKMPFSWLQIQNQSILKDFATLGACVLLLTLEGYLQFQYQIFEESYRLATFMPAIIFIFCAYFFDHSGVLSMGIVLFGAWLGLNVAPKDIFVNSNLNEMRLVYTGILFGSALVLIGWVSEIKNLKKHFAFLYNFIGGNLAFVALLTALFDYKHKFIYLLLILLLCIFCIIQARKTQSYMLLLMGVIYGYIGITYYLFHSLGNLLLFEFYYLYFALTCGGIVYFLINIKKILKNESLQ